MIYDILILVYLPIYTTYALPYCQCTYEGVDGATLNEVQSNSQSNNHRAQPCITVQDDSRAGGGSTPPGTSGGPVRHTSKQLHVIHEGLTDVQKSMSSTLDNNDFNIINNSTRSGASNNGDNNINDHSYRSELDADLLGGRTDYSIRPFPLLNDPSPNDNPTVEGVSDSVKGLKSPLLPLLPTAEPTGGDRPNQIPSQIPTAPSQNATALNQLPSHSRGRRSSTLSSPLMASSPSASHSSHSGNVDGRANSNMRSRRSSTSAHGRVSNALTSHVSTMTIQPNH